MTTQLDEFLIRKTTDYAHAILNHWFIASLFSEEWPVIRNQTE